MSTGAPVRFKYVNPNLGSYSTIMYLERPPWNKTGETVRVCLVGPRGGFHGMTCVNGQELADALAEVGFRASEEVKTDGG
jgi:hypothetical protein